MQDNASDMIKFFFLHLFANSLTLLPSLVHGIVQPRMTDITCKNLLSCLVMCCVCECFVCVFFFLLLWVGRRRCNYACSGKIYMQKKVIAIIGVFLVLYLQHKRWIEWKWPWDNGCNVLAPVRLPFAHSLACLCVCVRDCDAFMCSAHCTLCTQWLIAHFMRVTFDIILRCSQLFSNIAFWLTYDAFATSSKDIKMQK